MFTNNYQEKKYDKEEIDWKHWQKRRAATTRISLGSNCKAPPKIEAK